MHSLELVKQCKFLASHFESLKNLTEVLCNSNELFVRSVREHILSADRSNVLLSSVGHLSLFYPLKIARKHGWKRLWDTALDHGVNGRAGIAILKLLSLTVFSDRRCPVDDCEYIVPEGTPLCMHFTECHTTLESNHTPENLAELIINSSPEHFSELQNLGLSFFLFKLICMYTFFNMTVCKMSCLYSVTCIYAICYHFCVYKSCISFPHGAFILTLNIEHVSGTPLTLW